MIKVDLHVIFNALKPLGCGVTTLAVTFHRPGCERLLTAADSDPNKRLMVGNMWESQRCHYVWECGCVVMSQSRPVERSGAERSPDCYKRPERRRKLILW